MKSRAAAFKIRDGQEYAYPRILQYYPHIKWFYYFGLCMGFFSACLITIGAIDSVSWLSRNYITIPNSTLMLIGVLIGMSVLAVLAFFLFLYKFKSLAFSSIPYLNLAKKTFQVAMMPRKLEGGRSYEKVF